MRRPEIVILGLFGLLASTAFLLLKLASEISEGDTAAFDIALLRQLRAATEGGGTVMNGLRGVMLDMTALGDNATLTLLTAIVAGYLATARRWGMAAFLVGSVATGAIVTTLLKLAFERPRPDVVAHLVSTSTASFPSGHAMNSAVAYLTIAALVVRNENSPRMRAYVLSVAVALTLLVGVSRLYAGVHWPTDVFAGWMVGATWAVLCAAVASALQRRGAMEPAPPRAVSGGDIRS